MVVCTKCGTTARDEDRFCGQCGTALAAEPVSVDFAPAPASAEELLNGGQEPRPAKWLFVALICLFALVIVGALFKSGSRNQVYAEEQANAAADAAENASREADNAMNAALTAADRASGTGGEANGGSSWSYASAKDEMTDQQTSVASLTSSNSISQDFPYQGETTLQVNVRKHPRHGTDVYFILSNGQLLCPSYEGCSAMVRFDDAPAHRVSMLGSSDNSSDTVFVSGASSFIAKLKAAKKMVVALEIYQSGAPNFTFDTKGLRWPAGAEPTVK